MAITSSKTPHVHGALHMGHKAMKGHTRKHTNVAAINKGFKDGIRQHKEVAMGESPTVGSSTEGALGGEGY